MKKEIHDEIVDIAKKQPYLGWEMIDRYLGHLIRHGDIFDAYTITNSKEIHPLESLTVGIKQSAREYWSSTPFEFKS